MESQLQNELRKIQSKEKLQKKLTKYISGPGKWLLLLLRRQAVLVVPLPRLRLDQERI